MHGDMIFVEGGGGTDYRSIVYKTFALVQWVVANRQPKFILKTDDDAYVHTANLIGALRAVRLLLALRLSVSVTSASCRHPSEDHHDSAR